MEEQEHGEKKIAMFGPGRGYFNCGFSDIYFRINFSSRVVFSTYVLCVFLTFLCACFRLGKMDACWKLWWTWWPLENWEHELKSRLLDRVFVMRSFEPLC
jgi:hypothetical protein